MIGAPPHHHDRRSPDTDKTLTGFLDTPLILRLVECRNSLVHVINWIDACSSVSSEQTTRVVFLNSCS